MRQKFVEQKPQQSNRERIKKKLLFIFEIFHIPYDVT